MDDMLLARMAWMSREEVLGSVATKFEWKWTAKKFVFRGREIEKTNEAIIVTMRQYAASLKGVLILRERRKQLDSPLTEDEAKQLLRCAGEIGWIGRQGRLDLSFLAGQLQRASAAPCVVDLVRCNMACAEAKKGKMLP